MGTKINEAGNLVTRPDPVGATEGPNPWWHHRGPANDRERLQLAAARYVGDRELDRAIAIRERHPRLFGMLPVERQLGIPAYEAARQAAQEVGKSVAELEAPVLEEIDQAAAIVLTDLDGPPRANVDAEQRRGFEELVAAGAPLEQREAYWRTWIEALDADYQGRLRVVDARTILGIPATMGGGYRRPDFDEEQRKARDLTAFRRTVTGPVRP